MADTIGMDFPAPPPGDPDETERFSLQTCPYCRAFTMVALCLAKTACNGCGREIEVAPLAGAGRSPGLRC